MSIIEKTEIAKRLWMLLVPLVPAPADAQFARWASRFAESDIERVFGKVGRKIRREGMCNRTSLDIWRYTTGCLLNQQRTTQLKGSSALDEALTFLGTVMPQLDEKATLEYQQNMQLKPNERVADLYFDEPDSEIRKAVEAALKDPKATMPFGMQR